MGANSTAKGHVALIVANIIFGMNFTLFVSIIDNYMSFENLFFARVLLSALIFIPFGFIFMLRDVTWKIVLKILGTSVLIIYGKQFMMLWGAGHTNSIDSSTLATLGPIFTLVVSAIVVHEKIHSTKVAGIILGITGAMILIFHAGIPMSAHGRAFGDILILISVIAASTNTVFIKPVLMKYGTLPIMGWYYIVGLIITAPFFYKDFFQQDFSAIPTTGIIEILFVCLIGTILPNYLLYYGTNKLTSIHTAIYFYLQPISSVVLSTIRGTSSIDNINILSMVCIFTGIILIVATYNKYKFPTIMPEHGRK